MLLSLSIRNIVLIEALDLSFAPGLCVLTGETGAGKSIVLDSLGLALGERADTGLVRAGAESGSVVAEFDPPADHPARAALAEQDLAEDGPILLRRIVGADGRSRAFVNDRPAGVQLLRRLAGLLVEVHGQHDERGLTSPAQHRLLLDAFAGNEELRSACRACWDDWRAAGVAVAAAEAELEAARREEEWLRHAVSELDALAPEPGEEAALAEERHRLQQGERIGEAVREAEAAMQQGGGIDGRLRQAEKALLRVAQAAGGRLDETLAALDRVAAELNEAQAALERAAAVLDPSPERLERAEERLFALRDLARKHRVAPDALPDLHAEFARRLAALEEGGDRLGRLTSASAAARRRFMAAAQALGAARAEAAGRLDAAMTRELAPLRLDRALFRTVLEPLEEADWSAEGTERASFQVATNPGTAPGPLSRIASGGELSRFMLALKVALTEGRAARTMVFDEVDSGVGGAVADRIGERLARLGEAGQVLVVTHSPQVAARGTHHWRVAKREAAGRAHVDVERLDEPARREEIARMLAGAEVTGAARAAAESLLAAGQG